MLGTRAWEPACHPADGNTLCSQYPHSPGRGVLQLGTELEVKCLKVDSRLDRGGHWAGLEADILTMLSVECLWDMLGAAVTHLY